ncbi:MAG: DnaB-like helicase C-terminal domain-containing protein, partial [Planctomycetota bacterium]|jgi:replicative DNA helicase
MLMYRDEYYHADSPDKGTAEVIVGKNRTGPTGVVKLAFIKEFLRFEDLARETV